MAFPVEVGPVAYGLWRFADSGLDTAVDKIEAAVSAGMTLIDTADIYGYPDPGFGEAETRLGEVLAEVPGLRDQIVIATKGGIFPPEPYDSSPDYLVQACDASLFRLGVDRIDLYQIHRPDLLTHPGEVAETLDALVAAGKVAQVGVSNHTPGQTAALAAYLETPLLTIQPEFSLLHLDPMVDGTLDQAMELGLAVLAWSPMAGGRLAGEPSGKRHPAILEVCRPIAEEHGVPPTSVYLAWLMHHPAGVIPIVGTQRLDRIAEAGRAESIGLSRQQWYEILVAARGEAMP